MDNTTMGSGVTNVSVAGRGCDDLCVEFIVGFYVEGVILPVIATLGILGTKDNNAISDSFRNILLLVELNC